MTNALQTFNFETKSVRVIMQDGEPWWVANDVCGVLGLANPHDAVSVLDDDQKMGVEISDPHGRLQLTNIISESGVYRLIFRSNKPEANKFRRWVTGEVLPSIRKTGAYSINKGDDKILKSKLAQERLAIQHKNANARLAKALQKTIDNSKTLLTDESRQILLHEIIYLTTGRKYPEMLPDQTEHYYSASEIGRELGISNKAVMKLARTAKIIPPEGQYNEYGRWKMSKSPYSRHECSQWFFTDSGRGFIKASVAV